MLSTPFQNTDYMHRSEVVADQRSAEISRQNATQANAHQANRKMERHREETVESTEETALQHDRDADPQWHQDQKKRQAKPEENASSKAARPKPRLAPGHIDLQA